MNKRGKWIVVIGLALIVVLISVVDTSRVEPTAIQPAQSTTTPTLSTEVTSSVLPQALPAKSIAECVNERSAAYRKSEEERGNDPVIPLGVINEYEQECQNSVAEANPAIEVSASKVEEPQTRQSQEREVAVARAAQSAKLLTPEGVVWMKHMSLGLSAETLPRTRACDGVRAAVSDLLRQDDTMLELNNRAFKAGFKNAFDDQSRVDLLDRTADHGDWVAARLRCPEWQESRREVLWWFRGLTRQ